VNILIGSPQLNIALVGQGNSQSAANIAVLAGAQLIGQGAANVSGIGQANVVV